MKKTTIITIIITVLCIILALLAILSHHIHIVYGSTHASRGISNGAIICMSFIGFILIPALKQPRSDF